jgi:carbonic anhydrase
MVAAAARGTESVGVDELQAEMAEGALVVDLRETEERFAHGAIPGVLHAPRGMLEFWADPSSPVHRPQFDPSRRIIFHCAIGGRSVLAAATLQAMGYDDVAHLEGGFAAWRAAGKPIEPVTAPSSEFVARTGVGPTDAAESARKDEPRAPGAEGADATAVSAIDAVLAANREYAAGFTEGGLPGRPPSLRLAVVSCLDCRVHVAKLLGLDLGAAHIIRNAGGIVTEDVLRSLIISYHIGGTREIMIINNTKCGMLTFKDEDLEARLQEQTGQAPVVPARFLAFTDLEANVHQQIRRVRSHPWIPQSTTVRGFIYDVDTGRLTEVSP